MAGRNNRRLGNDWETRFIKILSERFRLIAFKKAGGTDIQVGSSRQFSKNHDDEGVDVFFTKLAPPWIRKYLFQTKRTVISAKSTSNIDISGLTNISPDLGEIPVLVTDVYKKNGKRNERQQPVVTLYLDDFLKFMEHDQNCYLRGAAGVQETPGTQPELPQEPVARPVQKRVQQRRTVK